MKTLYNGKEVSEKTDIFLTAFIPIATGFIGIGSFFAIKYFFENLTITIT